MHVGRDGGQSRGVPVHVPPEHTSPVVHQSPSSHPFALFTFTQPVVALQLSSVHGLPSLQLRTVGPRHTPALQTSPVVHASPSSQARVCGV